MEIVVLCGVPGSGKSTLSRTMFSDYVRINLDTLRTRHREDVAISQAISRQRSMVIDNTNVTSRVRRKYIEIARKHGFRVRAVCLVCPPSLAISRNSKRKGTKEYVPVSAIMRYYRIFEIPTKEEGFDSVEFVLQMPEEMQANAKSERSGDSA
jgi:predicted kinase